MNSLHSEDTTWALAQLQQHVSYTGWLFAMTCGMLLWMLMFRLVA